MDRTKLGGTVGCEKAMRRAAALEQKVIRMKQAGAPEEPGSLIADIIYEKRGRKLVPRLHVRKRRSGAGGRSD